MSHWVKPRKGYVVVEQSRGPILQHKGMVHYEQEDKDNSHGRVVASAIDDIRVGALLIFSKYEGIVAPSLFPEKKTLVLRDDQIVCEVDEDALRAAAGETTEDQQKAEAAASASLEAERARLHAVNNLTT